MQIKTGTVVFTLLLVGVFMLYRQDAATVAQAQEVEAFILGYCQQHKTYPATATLQAKFPNRFGQGEWFYWPSENLDQATYQYPMTLPLPSAPGKFKLSEFFPVIYAYAHRNACGERVTVG